MENPFSSPFEPQALSPELEAAIKKEMGIEAFAIIGTETKLPCAEEIRGEMCAPHTCALHVIGIDKKYLPGLLLQVADTINHEISGTKHDDEDEEEE